jgi:predicted phosphatase
MNRNELREKIAEIIKPWLEDGYESSRLPYVAEGVADEILAIPEIANALKLVVIDPHPLQRD